MYCTIFWHLNYYRIRVRSGMIAIIALGLLVLSGTNIQADFVGRNMGTKPDVSSLSKGLQAVRADLAAENLQVHIRKNTITGKNTAVIAVQVHNVGFVQSGANALTFTLKAQPSGKTLSRLIKIPRLEAKQVKNYNWTVSIPPAKCVTITASVDDPGTPANNAVQKSISLVGMGNNMTKPINRGAVIRNGSAIQSSRHTLRPIPKIPLPQADLTVSKITFNDFKAKKANETWVEVEVRNVGKITSKPTRVKGSLKRADGSTERNDFPVPRLLPRHSTVIQGPIRMTKGINTLTMQVIDPGTPGNNTLTRRHRFGFSFLLNNRRTQTQKHPVATRDKAGKLSVKDTRVQKGKKQKKPFRQPLAGGNPVPPAPAPPGGSPNPPDLKVIANTCTPDPITINSKITCVVDVVNIGGNYPIDRNSRIIARLMINGPLGSEPAIEQSKSEYLPPITSGGDKAQFTFQYYLPAAGSYLNRVKVFFSAPQGETNLSNNEAQWRYHVTPLPDLSVVITHPSDVKIGGHKRWFRFQVKNVGEARSGKTTMRLHIDEDGTRIWEVPPLEPGETFPASKRKKRGIRWWRKGVKRYQISVNRNHDFAESNWRNNSDKGSLFVYTPKMRFDPKVRVYYLPDIYKKKQAPVIAGSKAKLVFRIVNKGRGMSDAGKFTLIIQPPGKESKVIFFEQPFDALFNGEGFYKQFKVTFSTPGKARYVIKRYLAKKHRRSTEYIPFPKEIYAQGTIEIIAPQLGEPPRR